MKIKIVHDECGREILVQQVLESQGHCPWDGKPFERDYTAMLAQALVASENAGSVLESALEKIAGMNPEITIDRDSILELLNEYIDRLNAHRVRGGT